MQAYTCAVFGMQLATYTDANGTTVRPLGDIEDEAFALVNSLDATQRYFFFFCVSILRS